MDKIEELIQKGQTFNFNNNSYTASHGTYSKASDDLLGWAATVEDFIRTNYGEESSAFKLYQTFDRRKLTGYEQYDFDRQMTILFASLKSCQSISPISKKRSEENAIIKLLKNPIFWTVLVTAIGASFALGNYFGSNKFDKEKIELSEENRLLKDSINHLKVNKEVIKYLIEFDFRTSQIEKLITQVDTLKKDNWIPSLYIWRTVTGDNAYEPTIKEFRNVPMTDLANWIKTNVIMNKDSRYEKVISVLEDLKEYGGGHNVYDVTKVKTDIGELRLFIKDLNSITN